MSTSAKKEIETLQQDLARMLGAGSSNAFALIDPFLREPLDEATLSWPGCEQTVVDLMHHAIRSDQRPRLIAVPERAVQMLDESLLAAITEQQDALAEANEGFAISGWISTPHDAFVVVNHLADISTCVVSGMGRQFLRWMDRRVFEWMWPVLSLQQRARLLGPIDSWVTLDRLGRLVCRVKEEVCPIGALSLSAEQWAHAQNCEAGQHLLRGWTAIEPLLPANYVARAAHAVAAIKSLGVTALSDIVLLGTYLLMVHPNLHQHRRFSSMVEQALSNEEPLVLALETIPDPEGWDEMRDQLNSRQHPANTEAANKDA